MSDTVRTFIAIEMSPAVREFLGRCQDRLRRTDADVRWVRPELIHLTLVFLGDVPEEMLADLESAVRGAVSPLGPMTLEARGAGWFPPRGLPRVVWVAVHEPTGELLRLQKRVADAVAAFTEKPENRAYQAHLTLGRVRSGQHSRALTGAAAAMAAEPGPSFVATEVVIFKSVLSSEGPTYTALARVPLGRG